MPDGERRAGMSRRKRRYARRWGGGGGELQRRIRMALSEKGRPDAVPVSPRAEMKEPWPDPAASTLRPTDSKPGQTATA